jgi:hypothetical protein
MKARTNPVTQGITSKMRRLNPETAMPILRSGGSYLINRFVSLSGWGFFMSMLESTARVTGFQSSSVFTRNCQPEP